MVNFSELKGNEIEKSGYQLSISCGSDIFRAENGTTLSGFFDQLDKRMYEEKDNKRNRLLSNKKTPN